MTVVILGTSASCVIGFRLELIKDLVEQGHDVIAMAVDFDERTRKLVIEVGAEPIDYQLSRSGLNPFSDLISTWRLFRYFKSLNPDVVFSYFSKPVIYGSIAAYAAGVKRIVGMLEGLGYVFTERPEPPNIRQKLIKTIQVNLYRIAFRLADRVIFLNQDDRNDLVEKYHISVRSAPVLGGIGLNLDQYQFKKPVLNPFRFLFIGRMLFDKGIREYISAAEIVKSQHPEAEFVILGGGDADNPASLSKLEVDKLTRERTIIYPGLVDDVEAWLASSSVFVLPSYREGFPRSTQEAMAVGRPVITTDTPGCRETVLPGENGFLVQPFNTDALANCMIYMIEHPEKVTDMGAKSRRIAERDFNAGAVNRRLIKLIMDD